MKKIILALLLLYAFSVHSQQYKFGVIKNITVIQGVVSLYIQPAEVIYDKSGEMYIITNNDKSIDLFKFTSQTKISDCLYNRIHPSNIINFKKELINNRQFVLFLVERNRIKELNINCYN